MSTARGIPFTSDSSESTAVMERYRKAYQTAQKVIDFAETVKLSGIFLAGMRALEPRLQQNATPTSYETFVAEEFVPLYEGKSAAA
jgi:hypothetical protein